MHSHRLGLAAQRAIERDIWIEDQLAAGEPVEVILPSLQQSARGQPGKAPSLGAQIAPLFSQILPSDYPLRAFQRRGVARLLRSSRLLLADDMGLGKTVQTLVAIGHLVRSGRIEHALVVCPTSITGNWGLESQRWLPDCVTVVATGSNLHMALGAVYGRAHILVTNYEQLRDPPATLTRQVPDLLVLDEAHRVRNWRSKTAAGLMRLRGQRLWALTGTPLESDRFDVAGLLAFLVPGGSAIQERDYPGYMLRARLRPYVLRREKSTVLSDLPPVIERREIVRLEGTQATEYEEVERAFRKNPSLAGFNTLRSLCDYEPATSESAKVDRAMELCVRIAESLGEKTVVFSYLLEPLRIMHQRLRREGITTYGPFVGELPTSDRALTVERFQTASAAAVLLASSRVAGEGLNLTEANHVIFLNRWWNPSANSQAVDRVNRLGQKRPVTVYYLEAEGTVESRLEEILQGKEVLFEDIVTKLSTGESAL